MACREDPPRSFRPLIALLTISDVGGCDGLALGVLVVVVVVFFSFFAGELVCGAGAADVVFSVSAMAKIVKLIVLR